MSAVDELVAYLVAQGVGASGASTSTVSIFRDSMPEWSGISVVLGLSEGYEGDRHYGDGVPTIERPMVEMLVRSTAPASGGQVPHSSGSKTVANDAYRALVSVANQTLSGSTWLNVDSVSGPPTILDRDPQGRIYWRCLFTCDRMST